MINKNDIRIVYAMPTPSSDGGMTVISKMYYEFGVFEYPNVYHFDTSYSWGESKVIRFIQSFVIKFNFVRFLMKHKIDVVFVLTSSFMGFYDKVFYCLLAKILGVKSVLNPVGGHFIIFHQSSFIHKFLLPLVVKIPDAIVSGTSYWYNYYNENFEIKELHDIPNPLFFRDKPFEFKEIKPTFTITFLSRLIRAKGTDTFINLIKELDVPGSSFRFIIAGTGPELAKIKNDLADYVDRSLVSIRGFITEDEKEEIFIQSDIYVLSTELDVLPISIMEAMSYGNVAISTPVGGIPDAIQDGETGFLTEPDDHLKIAKIIHRLRGDNELRNTIAKNGYDKVKSTYHLSVVLKSQMDLFKKLLEN
jgi:glycosyltransferase involved in cell wall biosynthesis